MLSASIIFFVFALFFSVRFLGSKSEEIKFLLFLNRKFSIQRTSPAPMFNVFPGSFVSIKDAHILSLPYNFILRLRVLRKLLNLLRQGSRLALRGSMCLCI